MTHLTNSAELSLDVPVRDRLDLCHAELVAARRALAASEQAHRRLADAYGSLDERYGIITQLFVAMDALSDASDEAAALRAISEVMVNLAGTEEFAIYELDVSGEHPMIHSFGLEVERFAPLEPSGSVAEALTQGSLWLGDTPHPDGMQGEPIACIPLRLRERVDFAVVVWSYLPQKRVFDGFDLELYALLANRAAPTIRAARLLEWAA
jgi:hypothetical protein